VDAPITMSRSPLGLVVVGIALSVPSAASAGPPSLPSEDRSGAVGAPGEVEDPGGVPPTDTGAASAEVNASAAVSVPRPSATLDLGDPAVAPAPATGEKPSRGDKRGNKPAADASTSDDPAMIGGRREPAINTVRGGLGLFGTSLADVGGRHSVRFGLHTDLFRRSGFIYDSARFGTDTNSRFRGTVNIGYSPFRWGEIYMSIASQANRSEREQPGRQDPITTFALGDIDLGIKGAHRFYRGGAIGLGGQLGLGLLSGARRFSSERVNFNIDALFTLDARYLTSRRFPFRFTTNIGWILDNSLKLVDWGAIADTTSREVHRFALGVNHSRVRMRYGVDFPIRLGKDRRFGLDPIAELAWDVSTRGQDTLFSQPDAVPSPLPRSSLWATLGLRANVISGLHLDLALDIGMISPNFEFGPPVPPWQLLFGLGWAFDPLPVIREVPAPVSEAPPPPPALDGRIVGAVVDESGAPIGGVKISFPGVTSTAIVADAAGSFTSFRFPEGQVQVVLEAPNGARAQALADLRAGEDVALTFTIEGGLVAPSGVLDGAFVDDGGAPVQATLQITGQGIDEPFTSTPEGLIRVELPAGDYSGALRADGYEPKSVRFTITSGQEMIPLRVVLTRDVPIATPNVSGNERGIRLKRAIGFKGDEISDKSLPILDELAAFLKGHPEFQEIEIGAHTDDSGNPGKRTQDRADAVRTYLLSKGVSPDRVSAKGYGDRSPVAVNLTASGRAKNNRVVLKVVRYAK
jgi:hypothetical protein